MKKRMFHIALLLALAAMLSGCGLSQLLPDVTVGQELPHLMVQKIDVSIHPHDPDFERHYQTQENLTALLNLLRQMRTADIPEEEPELTDGQTYYTVTATYASGDTQQYHLMGYSYLKVGDEPWCEIAYEKAMGFSQFIRDHQSDDGSYTPPETAPPAETTLPTETGTASATTYTAKSPDQWSGLRFILMRIHTAGTVLPPERRRRGSGRFCVPVPSAARSDEAASSHAPGGSGSRCPLSAAPDRPHRIPPSRPHR